GVLIAIVTLLTHAHLHEAVAARGRRAGQRAAADVVVVHALVTFLPILHEPVATARQRTDVGAHVDVAHVAVVAALARADEAIAADLVGAIGLARGVVGVLIAVVALLVVLPDQAVATHGVGAARRAGGVVGILIAVVALLGVA